MTLGDPQNQAMTFLRNTIAQQPDFGDQWQVNGIEEMIYDPVLVLHCDNGTAIHLTVEVKEEGAW